MPGQAVQKLKVKEAIVVEGRDDVSAVQRAAEALIIPTHGFGISKETLDLIAKAYHNQGIIILTDPDRAGENIRRKLTELFPWARQAFVPRDDALKAGDIGVENARPEAIQAALLGARGPAKMECCFGGPGAQPMEAGKNEEDPDPLTMEDMDALGLAGGEGAMERREALGKALGIGAGNAKAMLKKINGFGISRKEIWDAVKKDTI